MVLRPIAAALGVASGLGIAACGSGIPRPPGAPQPTNALVEVDYPPPPARVEMLPKQPSGDAVWINGEWLWLGRRWSWRPGMWVVSPRNAAYARRVLVRRGDGKLLFAPGSWRDSEGREVAAPDACTDGQAPPDDFDATPSR